MQLISHGRNVLDHSLSCFFNYINTFFWEFVSQNLPSSSFYQKYSLTQLCCLSKNGSNSNTFVWYIHFDLNTYIHVTHACMDCYSQQSIAYMGPLIAHSYIKHLQVYMKPTSVPSQITQPSILMMAC